MAKGKTLGANLGGAIDRNAAAIAALQSELEDLRERLDDLDDPPIGPPDDPPSDDPPPGPGKVVKAESGSQAHIRAAVARAEPGAVVDIPPGTWTWSDTLVLKKPVHLRGRGSVFVRRKGPDLRMAILEGDGYRVSGLTFRGTGQSAPKEDTGLTIKGTDFLVWDCRFEWFGWSCLAVKGRKAGVIPKGVIHDCRFANAIQDFGLGYGVAIGGHASTYDRPLAPGSGDMVYVEDCRFEDCRHAVDGADAARFVFRHNKVVGAGDNASMMSNHGAMLNFRRRACRWCEFYENEGASPRRRRWAGFVIRGGDGVIHNNRVRDTAKFCVIGYEPISRAATFPGFEPEYPAKDQTLSLHLWNNRHDGGRAGSLDLLSKRHEPLFTGRDADGKPIDVIHFERRPGYEPFPYPHPMRTS